MARDLHDTLAQSLAGTSLRLEGLKNWIRSGGDHPHQYTCTMHPEVLQDQPGDCPKCGMKLVEKH